MGFLCLRLSSSIPCAEGLRYTTAGQAVKQNGPAPYAEGLAPVPYAEGLAHAAAGRAAKKKAWCCSEASRLAAVLTLLCPTRWDFSAACDLTLPATFQFHTLCRGSVFLLRLRLYFTRCVRRSSSIRCSWPTDGSSVVTPSPVGGGLSPPLVFDKAIRPYHAVVEKPHSCT